MELSAQREKLLRIYTLLSKLGLCVCVCVCQHVCVCELVLGRGKRGSLWPYLLWNPAQISQMPYNIYLFSLRCMYV